MFRYFTVFCLLSFVVACSKQESDMRNQDELALQLNLQQIVERSNSVSCTDPKDWRYVALGQKACGGPKSYVAYSSLIDTVAFIQMVMDYNRAEGAFNVKYGVNSDCAYTLPPQQIICRDGKAELVYENPTN